MSLPKRETVLQELTWDTSTLFKSEEEFNKNVEQLQQLSYSFALKFTGKLTDPKIIGVALNELSDLSKKREWLEHYAFLNQSVDMSSANANTRLHKFENISAHLSAELSFFDSEILDLSEDDLTQLAISLPDYSAVFRHYLNNKKQRLAPNIEKTLAVLAPTFYSPENIYTQMRSSDMQFESFSINGKVYPMSFVLYENFYQYHENFEIRHAAFASFSKTLDQYKNTLAAIYYTEVSKQKTFATLRGYDSVIDYLLAEQEIPRNIYEQQIDTIINKFGPVMQKYVKLIKKERNIKKLSFADLQIDLDPEFSPEIKLSDAPNYISDAIKILGTGYHDMIMRAFSERWVDFPQNKGKETGGFETTPYDNHPFILMSWSDQFADLYTLVHELGHAGQALLTAANNPILTCNPSTYIVESPSTFNELLLTHSLLQKNNDPRMQRFAYTKMLTNTYYHNFVTHLLEAAYQREVYHLIDQGESFDGDRLSAIKKEVLQQFWGDAVTIDDNAALTWMRQSHYYMGLYSYTYSAGLTVATQMYLTIKNDASKVSAWLDYLKLGDQKAPLDATKVAGIDMTSTKPLEQTIKFLDDTVNKIIHLTEKLNTH
ncbi:oligoendopeptidase F [Liquorilactobacillus cacaonum]|uniref:Oligopeptidase F n=1 Tax=Liquorilactobacillus cacaonum DSM 21116 TaxID=1423729 RepID=A0A0R2CEI3_9LACO|nr:oligoendopeptidase F [Liquorilactobacillus cacaonum]KRM89927.1 oligoendopeptidase F [Liquorilactobacillus cacaonum DSM 21116]